MPRDKRRRWWLERGTVLAWHDCWIRHADGSDDHATRYEVAIWRLVQWQRIRMERERLRWCDLAIEHMRRQAAAEMVLLDADDAVLEARCEEDYWRERCRELERTVWEMVADQDWQLS
jgi:hypothetical protein